MKLDHHEELFRRQLQQHQVQVDTSKLWNEVFPFLHGKKKKRRPLIFWWIFGNGLVLAAISLFSVYNYPKSNPDFPGNKIPNQDPSIETLRSHTDELINPPNVSNILHKPVAYREKSKNHNGPQYSVKNNVVPTLIAPYVTSDKNEDEMAGNTPLNGSGNNNRTTYKNQSRSSEAGRYAPLLPDMKHMASTTVSPLSKQSLKIFNANDQDISAPFLKPHRTFKNKFNFFVEAGHLAYLGNTQAGYEFSNLDANEFLSANQINTQNQLHHTQYVGLGIRYNLTNSFYLKSMAAYRRSTSSQHLHDVSIQSLGNQSSEFIVPRDSTTSMADMELVDRNLTAIRHSLDYSITTGYEVTFRKLTISAELGFHANVAISRNGKYVNESGQFDRLSRNSSELDNQSLGIPHSWRMSGSLGYNILPDLNLFVGPNAHVYSKRSYDLASKGNASTFALMLGARYRL